MVIVLPDQLAHLLHGVGIEGRGLRNAVNERDLRPQYQAVLVGQLVGLLGVLVMRQPHDGGAKLLDLGIRGIEYAPGLAAT